MKPNKSHLSAASRKTIPLRPDPDKALAFLARLAAEFTTVLSLPDLLEHVLRVLNEEIGFDSCAVTLLEKRDGDDVLVVRAASGLREDAQGLVFPRGGKGLVWMVMESGEPVLIPDLHAEPRLLLKDSKVRSGIYAPLVIHGRPIGVLSAYRAIVGAFNDSDLNLLTVVARYLAGAFEVARLHEQLRDLAATDSLTGLANRRTFLDRLVSEIARSDRAGYALSIVLLDLNAFKGINDTHGHFVGDEVLIRVAQTLSCCVRASDLAARFGGDEFILMLTEATGTEVNELITRLKAMEISLPNHQGGGLLTFSWGIAAFPDDGQNPHRLLQVADERLYAMKQQLHGRSQRHPRVS